MRLLFDDYIKNLHARWLGRVIGVRYGTPIEEWSYQKINDIYGELDGISVVIMILAVMMIQTCLCF
jgi:hypothetical protein